MTTMRKIMTQLNSMPDSAQHEVLDFVEFLLQRRSNHAFREDDLSWTEYSLAAALRGMEDEETPYAISDLKKTIS
jgi:hypothetical protein